MNVNINGARLEYVEKGTGDPVVFVHGGISDWRTWTPQLGPVAAAGFRTIAYSRRYHWPNQPIPDGVDDQMATHVEDLRRFLETVDASPAHLVGNSWGAFVCLKLAIEHPRNVRSLVLEEPPVLPLFVSNTPKASELVRLLLTRPGVARALISFGAKGLGPATKAFRRGDMEAGMALFAQTVLGAQHYADLPAARKEQMRANVKTLAASLLGAGFPPLTANDVRKVKTPTLLVTGQFSPKLLLRLTDRLEELLPQSRRMEIAQASHVMHEQNPNALNEILLKHLRSV